MRRTEAEKNAAALGGQNMGSVFEATMLVCFGFSWPLNVMKAYKARSAKGTSLAFILLIITGYVAGRLAKFTSGFFGFKKERASRKYERIRCG